MAQAIKRSPAILGYMKKAEWNILTPHPQNKANRWADKGHSEADELGASSSNYKYYNNREG